MLLSRHTRRREFITLLGGAAAAWPLAARAQQFDHSTRRVGVLTAFAENDRDAQANMTAFRQALEKLGWAAGRNVRIDYRWGGAEPERIRTYAIELVRLKPDLILAVTAQALQPLQQVASTIPIVFIQIGDPIGSGFVTSMAHPGGNITGFTPAEFSMQGKKLEMLKEVAPQITRVAVLSIRNKSHRRGCCVQLKLWRHRLGCSLWRQPCAMLPRSSMLLTDSPVSRVAI
jgi:putative ABC transport system substrate-binding protein